ncbi:retrovirus-related pol polyprotein from transposon TNT 1-94 [Tanacetum coccineum]
MDFTYIPTDGPAIVEMVNATKDNFDVDDLVKFQELLLDAEKPLYEGCPDFTKLSAIVKLLNLKGKYGASDKFFTELLGLIKKMLPAGNEMAYIVYAVLTAHIQPSSMVVYEKKVYQPFGVDTYDASTKDNFNLRAIVLWTINDYPALGTLCGCPYSGFKGCVVCGKDTNCVRLSASSKQSYVGHKRYLPYNHPFRKQKKAFNGQQEFLQAPIPMTGEQIYNEVKRIENSGEKEMTQTICIRKQKIREAEVVRFKSRKETQQKKRVVQAKSNRTISIVGTLLHVPGKTKDGLNARLDLAELGVKPELFAMQDEDKTTLPPAGYTLTNAEKDIFCETLHNIKVIKGHVQNRNKPEGCIAEETIAEETIEFFSEYHKSMETIGIPPDKHETYENEEGKPLSAKKTSEVSAELFQKAHLYVIHNTDEIVPYIERHKQVLKTENPGKRIAFLENEHIKSFAKWLREEVGNPFPSGHTHHTFAVNINEYKDNGRFWGSKSGCNESDVKPYWKDIKKAKACMLAKAQASEASSKAKVEARGIIDISLRHPQMKEMGSKCQYFYGAINTRLLDAYGYNTIEEYLSWNYFPSIDNESTDMETTDKRNTDKDCIGSVLGLPNVTTWDEIEKKMGARKSKTYADKAKGKRKVSCGS